MEKREYMIPKEYYPVSQPAPTPENVYEKYKYLDISQEEWAWLMKARAADVRQFLANPTSETLAIIRADIEEDYQRRSLTYVDRRGKRRESTGLYPGYEGLYDE